jgi:mannose-1-phosphate guanylyltransferase/mannose-1-phosphate guanylyltransferase/mannose-6-phosphate isomerase
VTADARIIPVILSGGAGTRLWPLSRGDRPKQLQPLAGVETMLQATAARATDAELFEPPIVVAGAGHADEVERQLGQDGAGTARLIVEPEGRNTAAAIALAALEARPDALLLVMPSDHVIADPAAFRAAVCLAAPIAQEGWLVTFGICPDRPETGYGYIRRGRRIADGVFEAEAFVEKPDRDTAARYLAEGNHDWNGGIFLFRADALLAALGAHAADILAGVEAALGPAERDGGRILPDPAAFAQVRAQSIDHAVMEKADRIAVVPVQMGWSDLGSWDALYEIGEPDGDGNVAAGDVLTLDTRHSLLKSAGPLIVAIGMEELVVVATPDAVLIAPRGQTQRVKEAVDLLKARRRPDAP